uniref:Uncharacterized protein n=1 Tax=Talaromyces marneffei PM1 TaxID=1077442 RepID=A0A093VT14_TALMA
MSRVRETCLKRSDVEWALHAQMRNPQRLSQSSGQFVADIKEIYANASKGSRQQIFLGSEEVAAAQNMPTENAR